jgi:hypothetical protein
MPTDVRNSRMLLIRIVMLSYPVVFALMLIAGLKVDGKSTMQPLLWLGSATLLCSIYTSWRGMYAFRNTIEPVCFGLLSTMPSLVSSYLAVGAGMPLADDWLAWLDRSLGLDWRGFIQAVDDCPPLAYALSFSYQSLTFQLIGLPVLLALHGLAERSYRMVAAYVLVCFSASAIAIWFPAIGAYPYFEIAADKLQSINIHFGYFFLDEFHGVRDDPNFVFSPMRVAGILTFPSVHAAAAALCAWAAWDLKFFRYPFLLLNVAMAIAAVTHGSHYIIDVPAGILLAGGCIMAVNVASGAAGMRTEPKAAMQRPFA